MRGLYELSCVCIANCRHFVSSFLQRSSSDAVQVAVIAAQWCLLLFFFRLSSFGYVHVVFSILRPNLLWAFWMFGKVFDYIDRLWKSQGKLFIFCSKSLFSRYVIKWEPALLVHVVVQSSYRLIFPLWTCLDHSYISSWVSFSRMLSIKRNALPCFTHWPHPSFLLTLWATPSIRFYFQLLCCVLCFTVFVPVLLVLVLLGFCTPVHECIYYNN